MRDRKLTFGDRVHCPVLRPFFLYRRRRSADPRRLGADRRDRRARRGRGDGPTAGC